MRALYLFINGLASSNTERPGDRSVRWADGPDGELVPIRPGAFARWMMARDASSGPGGSATAAAPGRGRGRRAMSPR
ncbi:MAG: hypothetical protein ACSLFN_06605 [Candidatus Limnocylindrales bacterium]